MVKVTWCQCRAERAARFQTDKAEREKKQEERQTLVEKEQQEALAKAEAIKRCGAEIHLKEKTRKHCKVSGSEPVSTEDSLCIFCHCIIAGDEKVTMFTIF